MNDIFDTRFENSKVKLSDNRAAVGDDVNLMAKDPTLHRVLIGVGWDLAAFDADVLDLDVSVFMLNKDRMTRIDEDFVFYNNKEDSEKAIVHNGDNRTGAGDGDDETISIDLHGISYDIHQLQFVVSIYKGVEKRQNISMIRNAYLRVVNADTGHELIRYQMDKDIQNHTETAVIVANIDREGPKWHFRPVGEFVEGGLGALARRYGLIINQE